MERKITVLFSFLFVAMLFATLGIAMEMAVKCPLCGMNMAGNENTAYEIVYQDNTQEVFCCPHCGLYVNATKKDSVKSAKARDFISGEWMDPAQMTFVFKSNAVPACAPSWIAFGNKTEAENFQKGFGGTVYSFDEALTERAKMPQGMEM